MASNYNNTLQMVTVDILYSILRIILDPIILPKEQTA